MENNLCISTGHNFAGANIYANGGSVIKEQVIFCTKCGETRKLEIPPKAGE